MRTWIVLCVALAGCAESGTVRGSLTFDGQPAPGATVAIDGSEAVTDAMGRFEIPGVSAGHHELTTELAMEDGGFVQLSSDVEVDGDVDMGPLALPLPVEISMVDATTGTVTVAWTPAAADGFREYKVYRHNDSGLDETTGELIHVTTDAAETTFVDEGIDIPLPSNTTFYYRVYVLDSYGGLAGSNVLAASTRLWDADAFSVEYQLDQTAQYGLDAEITGVAWDGAHMWLILFTEVGGYYDPNEVSVAYFDHETGEILRRFEYEGEYDKPDGLAWDGSQLWLNYTNTGVGTRKVVALDPETGEIAKTIITVDGVDDLSWDGEYLLLNNLWNHIDFLDTTTGAIVKSIDTVFDFSTVRGLAYRPGELWLSSQAHDQFAILDEDGVHIGIVDMDLLEPGWNYAWDLQLEFVGDQLAFVKNGRLYLFDVTPIAE